MTALVLAWLLVVAVPLLAFGILLGFQLWRYPLPAWNPWWHERTIPAGRSTTGWVSALAFDILLDPMSWVGHHAIVQGRHA